MTKVISLSNDAYGQLKAQKEGKESFSDVVKRLIGNRRQPPLSTFCGLWKGTNIEEIKNDLKRGRKDFRMRDVVFK